MIAPPFNIRSTQQLRACRRRAYQFANGCRLPYDGLNGCKLPYDGLNGCRLPYDGLNGWIRMNWVLPWSALIVPAFATLAAATDAITAMPRNLRSVRIAKLQKHRTATVTISLNSSLMMNSFSVNNLNATKAFVNFWPEQADTARRVGHVGFKGCQARDLWGNV